MVPNHSIRTFASPKTRWKWGSSALRSSSVSLTSKTRTRFTGLQRRGWDSNPRSFRSQTFQVCALSRTRRPLHLKIVIRLLCANDPFSRGDDRRPTRGGAPAGGRGVRRRVKRVSVVAALDGELAAERAGFE